MGEVVAKVDVEQKTQMVRSDARSELYVMVVLGLAC